MLWVVAAPGESLTSSVADACRGRKIVAVNDAYKLFPFADVLYAADCDWWRARKGCLEFKGERWSIYTDHHHNNCAKQWGLKLIKGQSFYRVKGRHIHSEGFSFEPGLIHTGRNSGFQAVNLALQRGADTVVMVGFDMKGSHFFGEHTPPLRNRIRFSGWIAAFTRAAELLPEGIRIINATPDSALTCFPMMSLEDALNVADRKAGSPDRYRAAG